MNTSGTKTRDFGGCGMAEGPSSSMQEYTDTWRGIVLGRVFTHEGALHFVLEVDDMTGLCRISRRHSGRMEIIHMPLGEVVLRVKGVLDGAEKGMA